ncbi:hypothetical protein CKA32_003136 [Geitlerinema sp. FC II]|nr:hypothetical protein CKA32_003136 [Geitlerinema sp. FC II]
MHPRRIKGLPAKSQIGKWLPEIPGILEMPGIWLESKYTIYVFCQSPISKSFLHH